MRSVQVSKPKGPFNIVERDIPEPSATQVRIKVQTCGICHGESADFVEPDAAITFSRPRAKFYSRAPPK